MKPVLLISTTFETKEDAERLGRTLLEARLIACAQISGPISSLYRWQQQLTSAIEYTLSVKTIPEHRQGVIRLLKKEHPYQLPEILVQQITEGSEEYGAWVYGETTP